MSASISELLAFDDDSDYMYTFHTPSLFMIDRRSMTYKFMPHSIDWTSVPCTGNMYGLVGSKYVSDSTRQIFALARELVHDKIAEMHCKEDALHVSAILCLLSQDGKSFVPTMFDMTYTYDCVNHGVRYASGYLNRYTGKIPERIEDRIAVWSDNVVLEPVA